jgi:hypothetical protein
MSMHWRTLLVAHLVTLFLLSMLLMAATTVLLTYGSARVSSFTKTGNGKVPAVFRTRVLGCATRELPSAAALAAEGGDNATLTAPELAQLNLTSASAATVLQCALDPETAQRWWEAHLSYLGAMGAVLLVTLCCNLVATAYLLFTREDEEEDDDGGGGDDAPRQRRKGGGRDKRRRRRRRASSDDGSEGEGDAVQLTKRGASKRDKAAVEEEP